jgi:hypothetical protein
MEAQLVRQQYRVFDYIMEEQFYYFQQCRRFPKVVHLPGLLFDKLRLEILPGTPIEFCGTIRIDQLEVIPTYDNYPSFIDDSNQKHYI